MFFKKFSYFLSSLLFRLISFLFSLLSFKALHFLGKWLGKICFPLLVRYRKRSLSNLALATSLKLSPQEIEKYAVESLGNLFITALEYGKLCREKTISKFVTCVNHEKADQILASGHGIIFFCAHQANWEVLFLEGTSRMKRTAIGQPIKNSYLYAWILKMRQKFGGIIVEPKQAVREGVRALNQNHFLGIVGDQGMPGCGFSCPFFGRMAFTSPIPALLSYKSKDPIIVATTLRKEGKYFIHYSDPIWPDLSKSLKEEIPRLMNIALSYLEKSIEQNPGQWLWQHNKWKQQGPGVLKRKYRHDTMAIILPLDEKERNLLIKDLSVFREIYPTEFITLFTPKNTTVPEDLSFEVKTYETYEEIKQIDYRFKLLFNFTTEKTLSKFFKNLAVFETLSLKDLEKKCPRSPFAAQLKKVILNAR